MFQVSNSPKARSFGRLTADAKMTRSSVNAPVLEQPKSDDVPEHIRREWMGR